MTATGTARTTDSGAPRTFPAPALLLFFGVALLAAVGIFASPFGEPFRETLQTRAAIVLQDDFDGSLEGWFGPREWSRSWSREGSGSVRAGQLALYRPSLHLRDYHFEFFGEIGKKSIGWVFRAADLRNYYVARVVVDAPGPPVRFAFERAAVVGAEESQRIRVPIRAMIDVNRPFRVDVDVKGNGFQTAVEGEVVDFWSDELLTSGGVGFIGAPDDRPRIYWMRVRHHDDALGRLCAWFAPAS